MPTLAPDYTAAELLDYGQQILHQLNNPPACESKHHHDDSEVPGPPHDGPGHYWVIFHDCPYWEDGGRLTLRCKLSIDTIREWAGTGAHRCRGCHTDLTFEQFCVILGTVNN